MNNQLIEKVIKSNDTNACPELTYENPLLDRNVAKALSKSFVKILSVSQQNNNINNNLRHSVLSNIRKTCRAQPENHVEICETFTNLLTEVYIEEVNFPHRRQCTHPVEKELDDFLSRKLKGLDLKSNAHLLSLNPEVAQALVNLDENSIETISRKVLDIDVGKKKNIKLLKDLWTKPVCESIVKNIGDISICMKSEIEKTFLDLCNSILIQKKINIEELFDSDYLKDLVQKCSISPECFQISCGILNCIFSNVNYSLNVQLFISEFIKRVKEICPDTISILYPVHLSHIVVLINIDVDLMPPSIQSSYVQNTLPYLKNLHTMSESDFVLLLTHFPNWFDIYFNQ